MWTDGISVNTVTGLTRNKSVIPPPLPPPALPSLSWTDLVNYRASSTKQLTGVYAGLQQE